MNIIKSYIVTNAAASSGGGGSGTVTSFSSGNLSPLFTTSVANPTTTPALTFTAVNQNANLVYAGPSTGVAAAPTFRALVADDLPVVPLVKGGTGITTVAFTPGTFLRASTISAVAWSTLVLPNSAALGSLLTATSTNNIGTLPIGVNGEFLSVTGGALVYRTLLVGDIPDISGTYLPLAGGTMSGNILFTNNLGIDVVATGGSDILNIGTSNADVINIGYSGSTINITGTLAYQNVTNLQVTDKLFTVNKGGGVGSGVSSGFEIEENGVITGYFATNGTRDGWDFKAPAITGVANLSLASLTGNHTYTLPDANGTFAVSASGNIALSAAGNITFTGVLDPANGGTGIANNAASTLTISGNFATTLTVTGVTGITLPTSGTLATVAGTWATTGTTTILGTATIAGAQTVAFTNTEVTFLSTVLKIRNPANTFQYTISAGAIGANRTVGIPVLGGTSFFLAGESGQMVSNRLPYIAAGDGQILSSANLTFVTNRLIGTTLYLTLSAGTATAGTCPFVMTTGTLLGIAIAGGVEYNNTFHMTNSDATRRHVVLAPNTTKVTAGAPFANDGYLVMNVGGTDFKIMTTA